jgi:hypothetical protein
MVSENRLVAQRLGELVPGVLKERVLTIERFQVIAGAATT